MFEVIIEKELNATITTRFARLCDALACGATYIASGKSVDIISMATDEVLISVTPREIYIAECVQMAESV